MRWRSAPARPPCTTRAQRRRERPEHRLGAAAVRHHAHALRPHPAEVRRAGALWQVGRPADLEKLIDANTRALFCETVGNPAGNVCDLEALAAITRRARIPLIVDNTVPTPILIRPFEYRRGHRGALAHQVPGRPRHHARRRHRRQRQVSLGGTSTRASRCSATPDDSYHGLVYTEHYGDKAFLGRVRSVFAAHHGRGALPVQRVPAAAGHRDRGAARRAARGERASGWPSTCAPTRGSPPSATRASPTIPTTRWRRSTSAAAPARS